MSIRKEQGLLLVVLALGVWYWTGLGGRDLKSSLRPKRLEVEEVAATSVVLAPVRPNSPTAGRDTFTEPSESSPLPPRELPFPELARLPVVLPPLTPGQEAGQFYQLRVTREQASHQFGAAAPSVGSSDGSEGGDTLKFDKLFFQDGRSLPVIILNDNKFDLADRNIIDVEVRYHWMSEKDGRIVQAERVAEVGKVQRIALADTVENEIGMRVYKLKGNSTALVPDRKDLISDLLAYASNYPQFYSMAEKQARMVVADSEAEDGYRWLLRVLRAQGALEREWQLYVGPDSPAELANTDFLLRGKGEVEAMLGLHKAAEADLRQAASVGVDGRSAAALARFLLDRGRPAEALQFAEEASRRLVRIVEADDKYRAGAVHVEVLLALGQLDAAQSAVQRLSAQNGQAAELAFLRGAVSYARGEYDRASEQFTAAAAKSGSARARLGLGLCAIAAGEWQEAFSNLSFAANNGPMIRNRAHSALAVLYELTGNFEDAIESIEAALLAAPKDPYSLYVQGRLKRLTGAFEDAIASHRQALAQRDDLVESLAEIAMCLLAQSRDAGDDRPEKLAWAARYADRAVKLDADRGKARLFRELQGLIKFELGDMAGAREAFDAALEQASDFALIGLATIDYKQKRTTTARDAFVSMIRDPSRPESVREQATQIVDLIDDHASKEQVRDSFDRETLGEVWDKQIGDRVVPRLDEGALVFQGRIKQTQPAYVRRQLQKSGNFLKLAANVHIRSRAGVTFAGLRLGSASRGGKFQLRVGVSSGAQGLVPFAYLDDSRKKNDEPPQMLLDVPGFDAFAPHRIEIEVQPGEKPSTFKLLLRWNGEVVHEVPELRRLRPTTGGPLNADLFVEGRGEIDVRYDDFQLNRRRMQ